LPIADIRKANPTWARSDLGDLVELRRSIHKNGIQLPLLLLPDNHLIDGARRLEAVDELGWDTVPVVITNDWDTVRAYYAQVHDMAEEGWSTQPPDWQMLYDISQGHRVRNRSFAQEGALYRAYAVRRSAQRAQTRATNNEKRQLGIQPKPRERFDYVDEVARMFGYSLSDFRTIRQAFARLNLIKELQPERYEEAKKYVRETEEANAGIYVLDRKLSQIRRGEEVVEHRHRAARRNLDEPHVRSVRSVREPDVHPMPAEIVTNIIIMLEVMTDQIRPFTVIDKMVPSSDAGSSADTIRAAQIQLNRLRRLLEIATVTNAPNEMREQ
jgi:hypothetical protein